LIDQPGAGFHYGHSTDLLGFLLGRLEGAPLGVVLERRVFTPLGMHDTGFVVPREKRTRRAGLMSGTPIAVERNPDQFDVGDCLAPHVRAISLSSR